ncbi:MAG: DoxX family protein [Saprospiraceae bacterium]|nr:DoxX family protein [Saprospiraceae bacterium]
MPNVALIRKICSAGLLLGIGLSLTLWTSQRLFPMAPVFPGLPVLPTPFDWVLLALLAVALLICLVIPDRRAVIVVMALLAVMLLQDQMRWQPWVYTYVLLLIPFAWKIAAPKTGKKKPAPVDLVHPYIPYVQIFLVGLYFWGGLHKLNANFGEVIYPLFVKALLKLPDGHWMYQAKVFSYFIPVTEIIVGIGLLIPRLRKLAAIGAIVTHLIIILYLSPLGLNDNHIVIPWNLAMIGVVYFSSFNNKNKLVLWRPQADHWRWLTIGLAVLVWLMPALNLRGKWDTYLSFNLYSGNINHMYVAVKNGSIGKLDKGLSDYFAAQNIIDDGKVIDVSDWSFNELNVPVYPEKRVFRAISRYFCELDIPADDLMFVEYQPPLTPGKYRTYTCDTVTR